MYSKIHQELAKEQPEDLCQGGSIIISPQGKVLAGPLFGKAGVLNAEIDLDDITNAKMDFDVNGHYSRNDIFQFMVKNQPETKNEKLI